MIARTFVFFVFTKMSLLKEKIKILQKNKKQTKSHDCTNNSFIDQTKKVMIARKVLCLFCFFAGVTSSLLLLFCICFSGTKTSVKQNETKNKQNVVCLFCFFCWCYIIIVIAIL